MHKIDEMLLKTKSALLEGNWILAKELAIDVTTEFKHNAQAWVFLGESLEKSSEFTNALAAFKRALILDPRASWCQEVTQRLIKYSKDDISSWMIDLLEVPKVKVSAAMIVKNEASTIGEAITRLKEAVDEIIVIDTGSVDGTLEIAENGGATVYKYEWNNDFAAARNYGLEKVTGDWVLWVDADEFLDKEDIEVPKIVAGLFTNVDFTTAIRIIQVNYIGDKISPNYDMVRFFPTNKKLTWIGKIHEQIKLENESENATIVKPVVNIRLHHHGYQKSVMNDKKKLERNIKLLELAVKENPDDIGSWGFLGREYYLKGDYEKSIKALQMAEKLEHKVHGYGRLPEVRNFLARALVMMNRKNEAIEVLNRSVTTNPEYPGGWYDLGLLKMEAGIQLINESRNYFNNSLEKAKTYRGIVYFDEDISSWKAKTSIADTFKFLGDLKNALNWYIKALESDPNNEAIKNQLNYIKSQKEELSKMIN